MARMTHRLVCAAVGGFLSLSMVGCGGELLALIDGLVADFLLPVEARETGPYVQMDGPDAVTVSWFTMDPAVGEIVVTDDTDPGVPAQVLTEAEATEHHAIRVDGLVIGHEYSYRLTGPAATDNDSHVLPTPKGPGDRIVFAVLGDSGSGSLRQYAVAARMAEADPDYILHTGDVVYPKGEDGRYDATVFRPYAAVMDHAVMFPSLGNHDVISLSGQAYLNNFILPRNGPEGITPERCYSIDLGDVHIVSIDRTLKAWITSTILPWLRDDLAQSDAPWKFVFFHYPLYTSGRDGRPMNAADAATWGQVFDEGGVDLCLVGHNHFYERTDPIHGGQVVDPGQGTVYITSGNGGAGLYTMLPAADFVAAWTDQVYGFTQVTVEGTHIEIMHVDSEGNVVDQVSWDKSP